MLLRPIPHQHHQTMEIIEQNRVFKATKAFVKGNNSSDGRAFHQI